MVAALSAAMGSYLRMVAAHSAAMGTYPRMVAAPSAAMGAALIMAAARSADTVLHLAMVLPPLLRPSRCLVQDLIMVVFSRSVYI